MGPGVAPPLWPLHRLGVLRKEFISCAAPSPSVQDEPAAPKPKASSRAAVAGLVAGAVAGGVGAGGFVVVAPPDQRGILPLTYGGFVAGGLLFGLLYDPLLKPIFKGKNEVARALTILLLGWALFLAAPIAINMTPPEGIPVASDVLKLLLTTRPASLGVTFAVFALAGLLFGLIYERKGAPAQ